MWPFQGRAKPSTLVVDDEPGTRVLLVACVEGMGWEAHQAGDGVEGVAAALQKRPDVILLDLDMPNMNGWDTLLALRNRSETKNTPVLMVTGRSTLDDVDRCLAAGANDYVVKPFDLSLVRAKLAKLLPAA